KIRVRIVWMSGKHNLELRDRLIEPVILEQKLSHSEMSDVVLAGDGECSVPKSLGVVPVRSLDPGPPGKQDNNNRPGNAENFTAQLKPPCKIDHCPRRSDVESDLWQVTVAIRVRLAPHLNQPDHRQEHQHIPEPAGD